MFLISWMKNQRVLIVQAEAEEHLIIDLMLPMDLALMVEVPMALLKMVNPKIMEKERKVLKKVRVPRKIRD